MKGTTVEVVASSWIEVLGGLSAKYILSVPPLFCAERRRHRQAERRHDAKKSNT